MNINEIKELIKVNKECPNALVVFSPKDVEMLVNLLEESVNTLDKYKKNVDDLYISNWENKEAMKELVYTCSQKVTVIKEKLGIK